MLNLRILRGPLSAEQYDRIRSEYDRLVEVRTPPANFQRWLTESPAGPALHAILESPSGQIVGHCCLIPFPLLIDGSRVTAAKAEYFFLHENYRQQTVAGFESLRLPAAVVLLRELYRFGSRQEQW